MSPADYRTIPATCPNCRFRFAAPVLTIIDPEHSPEAKALLLSGRLNIAVCPQCGNAGMMSVPLVYHDASKELFLTYVAGEVEMSEEERQKAIGELTNRVISSLPPDQRKGYLLRPRSFLRYQGMIEAILAADGITSEMLEEQRARLTLLERLLQVADEEALKVALEQEDSRIDYEFLEFLTLNLEVAKSQEQPELAEKLEALRDRALEWTSLGKEIDERRSAIESLGDKVTREGLLEKLVEAALASEQVKVETLISVARPAIDYMFYQQLTARIDAADKAGERETGETLRRLRSTVLDITAQIDAEEEAATKRASTLLQQLLESEDPEQAVRANSDQLDELFFGVLTAKLEAAERAGESDAVSRLKKVLEIVLQLIHESQPPEVRFVNELLSAEYPGATRSMLDERRSEVDGRLLEVMDLIAQDLEAKNQVELADRLRRIREQANSIAGLDTE